MKIRVSKIIKYFIFLLFILDYNFFLLSRFNEADKAKIITIVSLICFAYILIRYKNSLYIDSIKWILIYGALVIIMLVAHYIHDVPITGVGFFSFSANASYYTIYILALPLVYVFFKDGGTEKFFEYLNIIVLIWNILIIVQAVLYNFGGIVIDPNLEFKDNTIRNDSLRLNLRSMSHLMIIYNIDYLYNKKSKKIKYICLIVIGLFAMFYVEQTRGYYLAIALSAIAIILCFNRSKRKLILTILITTLVAVVVWKTNIIPNFYNSLFVGNNQMATGENRVMEYNAVGMVLKKSLFWGAGFQPTGDSFILSGVSVYFNDIGIVGLIGQIGLWAIAIYGLFLSRLIFIVVKLFKKKSEEASLLLGILVFVIATSISLICYWETTCLLCPVVWAIFEYKYGVLFKKKRIENVDQINKPRREIIQREEQAQ